MIRGRLQRWNDDKGFGFIRPMSGGADVFVHISAFRGLTRRPVVGDVVDYGVETNAEGRSRAVNARIEGMAPARPSPGSARSLQRSKRAGASSKLGAVVILVAVVAGVGHFYRNPPGIGQFFQGEGGGLADSERSVQASSLTSDRMASYRCEGKVYCSEMRSCEEAMFYLRNCPGTKMDGDRDGVPCESQWCGW